MVVKDGEATGLGCFWFGVDIVAIGGVEFQRGVLVGMGWKGRADGHGWAVFTSMFTSTSGWAEMRGFSSDIR